MRESGLCALSLGSQPYGKFSVMREVKYIDLPTIGIEADMASKVSPFFNPGAVAVADSLAIVHLKRDYQIPVILKTRDDDDEGYKEGKIVNTQFGCFPHNTLIGLPWGSQVRASKVDTGSRGRRGKSGEKRKRDASEAQETEEQEDAASKAAVTASSGFMHVLPPTPENWTSSLPHRTQVVYTPDYSYILHRLRARPGSSMIEAGAGSGSFTHASARAVYSGYPTPGSHGSPVKRRKLGKVWSFEFHEQRHSKLEKEIQDHGLDGIVQITHRDVCRDGFLVGPNGDESPNAEAIFLDLPAPWLALPHLTRQAAPSKPREPGNDSQSPVQTESKTFCSPLNPRSPVHIGTFSPCIEQVQRTVSTLRHLGWVDISMVEIAHKRLEVRRERVGIENGLQKGMLATAANVEEAVSRLKEVEGRFKSFHNKNGSLGNEDIEMGNGEEDEDGSDEKQKTRGFGNPNSRERILESLVDRKIYKEGRLVHRSEQEVKLHTSYLLFAVLSQEWSTEDEEQARAKWPVKKRDSGAGTGGNVGSVVGMTRKQMKKAAKEAQNSQYTQKNAENPNEELQLEGSKEHGDDAVDEVNIDEVAAS
jgi:tRNA (adenine57-N1/adenine58-N1)-methyltransferase